MYLGSCLCKGVAIKITGAIQDIIHCHCSLCRKSSGTAFATNGFVNTDEIIIEKGSELLNSFEMKPGRKRHFCSICASPIFSSNDSDPYRIRLRLGVLDSEISERPISHNFMSSRASWDSTGDELPWYDGHEPGR